MAKDGSDNIQAKLTHSSSSQLIMVKPMMLTLVVFLILWGLAFGIIAWPRKAVRVPNTYSSWVDCASLIGDI
jgi:hypothetical protein